MRRGHDIPPALPSPLTSVYALPTFKGMAYAIPFDCRFRINAGSLLTRPLPRAEAVVV